MVGTILPSFNSQDGLTPLGTITATERIEQEQMMYNLTVDTAHTFFVGEGEWLVHNTNCITYFPLDALGHPTGVQAVLDSTAIGTGANKNTASRVSRYMATRLC